MNRIIGLKISIGALIEVLFAFIFCIPWLHAQGEFFDMDYFAASRNPQARKFLLLVERVHYNDLSDAFVSGRFNYVRANLDYVLRRYPNHPKALLFMGSIAKLTKAPSIAIPYYQKAVRLYPQYALTHAEYGDYLADIGNLEAGIAQLKRAIEIDPKLPQAYAWLAKAYDKNGNPELARQASEKAKELGFKDNRQGSLVDPEPKTDPAVKER